MMLKERIEQTIQRYDLLSKGERVIVACSGGADSVCLFHLLLELHDDWRFELFLDHFNHGLRPEAWEDELFVKDLADRFSIPFFSGSEDVKQFGSKKRINLEEAGRELRYAFLKKHAERLDAKVATAHTMNDQAETFFMRLMRGSGMRGLSGISPVLGSVIVRPLIDVGREEVEAYLADHAIEYRVDESNLDRRYFRNRVRHDLIPYIQNHFDPGIVRRIGKLVSLLREEDSLLDGMAQRILESALVHKDKKPQIDMEKLSGISVALKRRVVRHFLSILRGDLRKISSEDVETILKLKEGKDFSLEKDIVLSYRKGRIGQKKEESPPLEYECVWDPGKKLVLKELQMEFSGQREEAKTLSSLDFDDEKRAFLDRKKLKFPLIVRNRKEGDRYQPVGAPGRQKLKEIMRAKGIPADERDKHPVFVSKGEIVWVLGLPVAEKAKIQDTTQEILRIERRNDFPPRRTSC